MPVIRTLQLSDIARRQAGLGKKGARIVVLEEPRDAAKVPEAYFPIIHSPRTAMVITGGDSTSVQINFQTNGSIALVRAKLGKCQIEGADPYTHERESAMLMHFRKEDHLRSLASIPMIFRENRPWIQVTNSLTDESHSFYIVQLLRPITVARPKRGFTGHNAMFLISHHVGRTWVSKFIMDGLQTEAVRQLP